MTRESYPPAQDPYQGSGRLYEPESLEPIADDGDHLDCARYWNSYVTATIRPGAVSCKPQR